jgi:branched-chain amino acid transport system substrate-binding protein
VNDGTGRRISRRDFVRGAGAAAAGGVVVGGVGGYLIGDSQSEGSTGTTDGGGTGGGGGGTIKIGSASPTSGPYSGDGQEMVRGQELAIEAINGQGGVMGRPLELVIVDVEDLAPEKFVNAVQRLLDQNVAAIFAGYASTSSAEFDVIGRSGVPHFHLNTLQLNADYVNEHDYTNIYHSDPTEIWYGKGFVPVLQELVSSGAWQPSSETAAIVTSNDPYSISIAEQFRDAIRQAGWEVTLYEEITAPLAEWGPTLSKIRGNPPGLIFHTDYIPGDLASFTRQFASDPTPSLLYEQYGPSVPEYLDLAGDTADGVIWSTVIGTLPDERGNAFLDRYQEKYNAQAGLSQAGGQYDLVHIWADAAARAGDPHDYERVNQLIVSSVTRGVSGGYTFVPGELTVPPYPDQVNDPSLGLPHLTFQIQNQEHVLIGPDPYTKGKFALPGWL